MKGQGDKEQLIAFRSFLLILSNFKMSQRFLIFFYKGVMCHSIERPAFRAGLLI